MNLAIGDELTPGYTSTGLNNRTKSAALSNALNETTISRGMKGASLTLKGKGNVIHQLNQFSLPAYDRIFLFYGENDYLKSKAKLGTIGKMLTRAVKIIRHKNQWIKIYGILPLPMYNSKGLSLAGTRGPAFYTLHDLITMLSVTYSNNRVLALDWKLMSTPLVTRTNYKKRLNKGRFPKPQTYKLMADCIGRFVKKHE